MLQKNADERSVHFYFSLAAATAAVVIIATTADAVKDNYDNDNPENPFATATIVVISKAHKSSSFQFWKLNLY